MRCGNKTEVWQKKVSKQIVFPPATFYMKPIFTELQLLFKDFSHMGFSNVFSQCVIWVFIHLKKDIIWSILNSFDEIQFIVFAFIDHTFVVKSENSSPSSRCQRFSIFFPLLFKVMIHFDLFFYIRCGGLGWSYYYYFLEGCPVVSVPFLKPYFPQI